MQKGQDQLPSPISSAEQERTRGYKRSFVAEETPPGDITKEEKKKKRRKTQHPGTISCSEVQKYKDRTTYWVFKGAELPPPEYFEDIPEMSSNKTAKRPRSKSGTESTQEADCYERLLQQGVFMFETQPMNAASQVLCDRMLQGDRPPAGFPVYRSEHRLAVQNRAAKASEAIIQRDILPTVVPSVENLNLLGEIKLDHFGDEINAL